MKTFIESLRFKDVEWIESEYKEGRYSKCYLPAPYDIGNIEVSVLEAHVSFHYCGLVVKKVEPKWQHLYGEEIICKEDGFDLDIEGISDWKTWKTTYGYHAGYVIDSETLPLITEFAKKLLTGYTKKTLYSIIGQNALKKREVIDWLTYTAMVWSRDEFLWESIVKIGYLTPDRYRLERLVKDWFEKHKDGTVTL